MRRKTLGFIAFLLSLSIYFSCVDEGVDVPGGYQNAPETELLTYAKKLVGENGEGCSLIDLQKGSRNSRVAAEYSTNATPLWNEAWEEQNGEEEILFVPLQNAEEIYSRVVIREGNVGSVSMSKSFSRLLVRTKHNRKIAHVLTYLPERNYAINNREILDSIGFYPEQSGFHGTILISELDGTLKHGIIYRDGIPTIKLVLPHQQKEVASCHAESHNQHNPGDEKNAQIYKILGIKKTAPRILIDLYNDGTASRSYSSGNENDNFICSFCGKPEYNCSCVTCEGEYIFCPDCGMLKGYCMCNMILTPPCPICLNNPCICYHNNCLQCNSNPCICPSGGGGSGGDSWGAGGGLNPSSPYPNAMNLFVNTSMSDSDWEHIESMLKKIKEDCLGEMLYHQLVTRLGGNSISIHYTSDEYSAYNPTTHTLKLNTTEDSYLLLHELLHAYQWQENPNSADWNASELNIEIEAHYVEYLYLRRNKDEYEGSNWEKAESLKDKRYFGTIQFYDFFGDKGIVERFYFDDGTVDLETTEFVFDCAWNTLVYNSWMNDSKYGGCQYDEKLNYEKMISNIKKLTKNC